MAIVKMVRIKSYYSKTGEFTGCEHVYLGNNHCDALDKFKKEYPEHADYRTMRVAETIEEDIDNPSEWFKAVVRCGCFH